MILILSFCEFVLLLFIINVIWSICLFLLFYFIIYCTLFISNFIFVARNLDLTLAPVLIGVRVFQRMFVFCLQFYGWEKCVLYKICLRVFSVLKLFWTLYDDMTFHECKINKSIIFSWKIHKLWFVHVILRNRLFVL